MFGINVRHPSLSCPGINYHIRGDHTVDGMPTFKQDFSTLNGKEPFSNNEAAKFIVGIHVFPLTDPIYQNTHSCLYDPVLCENTIFRRLLLLHYGSYHLNKLPPEYNQATFLALDPLTDRIFCGHQLKRSKHSWAAVSNAGFASKHSQCVTSRRKCRHNISSCLIVLRYKPLQN